MPLEGDGEHRLAVETNPVHRCAGRTARTRAREHQCSGVRLTDAQAHVLVSRLERLTTRLDLEPIALWVIQQTLLPELFADVAQPAAPTTGLPGRSVKVTALARRAAAGVPLFNPADPPQPPERHAADRRFQLVVPLRSRDRDRATREVMERFAPGALASGVLPPEMSVEEV